MSNIVTNEPSKMLSDMTREEIWHKGHFGQ